MSDNVAHIHEPDGHYWAMCRRCYNDKQSGIPAAPQSELEALRDELMRTRVDARIDIVDHDMYEHAFEWADEMIKRASAAAIDHMDRMPIKSASGDRVEVSYADWNAWRDLFGKSAEEIEAWRDARAEESVRIGQERRAARLAAEKTHD